MRHVKTFKLVSSGLLADILGWIRGKRNEYIDAISVLAMGTGREVTRVQSEGMVTVLF